MKAQTTNSFGEAFEPDKQVERVRVGVSACLVGKPVRYDGGHKRDDFLVNVIGRLVEWVIVCPEAELGLGVPREPMRLFHTAQGVRLVGNHSERDFTAAMYAFAEKRVRELQEQKLCGYVLKSNSPSCGAQGVPVWSADKPPVRNGQGLFAEVLLRQFPNLPVEEEHRLCEPQICANFVRRIFAYHRIQTFFAENWRFADLVAFHRAHKLLLLAHSPRHYAELGRLIGQSAKSMEREELRRAYENRFMAALKHPPTTGKHVNVLQHVAGLLKNFIDPLSYRELLEAIEDYRRGLAPLNLPMRLIRRQVVSHDIAWLKCQVYLASDPAESLFNSST